MKNSGVEASRVWPKIWVGSAPAENANFSGYSLVVLCAVEYQPELAHFPGKIVRPAFRDTLSPLTADELARIAQAANLVANEVLQEGRCLVTCQAGLNRSAFVAALAMRQVTNLPADEIIETIRKNRKPYPYLGEVALYNSQFVSIIKKSASLSSRISKRKT